MKKTILLSGLLGGVLIAGLKLIEYRFLVVDDLAGAEPSRDGLQDLQLARGDAELTRARRIGYERLLHADGDFDG